MVPVYIIRWCN